MTEVITDRCEYCRHKGVLVGPVPELEFRHGRVVCIDVEACDARDEANERAEAGESFEP